MKIEVLTSLMRLPKSYVSYIKFKHRKFTPYYPRANGQVEVTNGIMGGILTKTVTEKQRDWNEQLFEALWVYRTTFKVTTQNTPFNLVYGT